MPAHKPSHASSILTNNDQTSGLKREAALSGTGWAKPLDRRPKGWEHKQEHAERLVRLAQHLPASEASLIQSVYGDGASIARVAALLKQDPRSLGRRLKRLERRMLSPAYAYVVLNIETLEGDRARVARACVLEGLSIRAACARTGLSIHVVRIHRAALESAGEAMMRVRQAATSAGVSWRGSKTATSVPGDVHGGDSRMRDARGRSELDDD